MRLWPDSLRGRMFAVFSLPTVIFAAVLIGIAVYAAGSSVEREVGERLRNTAGAAAAGMPPGIIARFQPDNRRTHANLMARLTRITEKTDVRRVFISTPDGVSLVDTGRDAPAPGQPDRELSQDRYELERVARGETAVSVLYTSVDGVRFKRGYAPIVHQDKVVAVLGVEGSTKTYSALDSLSGYLTAIGLVALLVVSILVFVFGRALTAPLKTLESASAAIGRGALDAPIQLASGARELRRLAATMDDMRDALRTRDRELQMMLGGIAHEVRNPLGGMKLFVGLLREDLTEHPDESALLARVQTELETLERIVEEFLDFARQRPPVRTSVALDDLITEVDGMVPLVVQGHGLGTISVDRDLFRQVLLNMARNAHQAGAKTLTLGRQETKIMVEDDGPGVPAVSAQHIFDAFFSGREKGTGLGLALCKRIIEAHGGEIRLVNPGDAGAVFCLELPHSPPAA